MVDPLPVDEAEKLRCTVTLMVIIQSQIFICLDTQRLITRELQTFVSAQFSSHDRLDLVASPPVVEPSKSFGSVGRSVIYR